MQTIIEFLTARSSLMIEGNSLVVGLVLGVTAFVLMLIGKWML